MYNQPITTYKDLIVWQKSMELIVKIYKLTKKYPQEELYNLTSHTRKTSVSIPSNIAEGRRRGSKKDFRQFLIVAYDSGAELETQIEIAKKLIFCNKQDFQKVDSLLNEVMRMLNTITKNLKD